MWLTQFHLLGSCSDIPLCRDSLWEESFASLRLAAWYRDGEEMARVELAVNSPDWRTWSSKELAGTEAGNWRVDVLSAAGDVLATKEFTVTADAN